MNLRALIERFIWGLSRPLKLIWALRRDSVAFQRALKAAVVQVMVTVALATGVVAYRLDELNEPPRAERTKVKAPKAPKRPPMPRAAPQADEHVDRAAPVAVEQPELEEPAPPEPPEVEEPGEAVAEPKTEREETLERVASELEGQAEHAAVPEQKAALLRAAAKMRAKLRASAELKSKPESEPDQEPEVVEDEVEDEEPKVPWWRKLWAYTVSAIFGAQWVVLALARDYQDRTSRDLALVAGIEPEEPNIAPRVRIDFKWLRRKLRRRIRGLQVLIPGFLIASPVFVMAWVFEADIITTVLTGAWTFYWWMVFSAARTARAWAWEKTAVPNAPLRGWIWLTNNVAGFRWWGPRVVSWVWVRTTREMFSPAKAVELDPAAFAGLALMRLIGNVPLLRILLRPVMSVVAAEIVLDRAREAPVLTEPRDALQEPTRHAREQAGVS